MLHHNSVESKQCLAQNTSVGETEMRLHLRVGEMGVGKTVGETEVGKMGIPQLEVVVSFLKQNGCHKNSMYPFV